MLQLQLEFVEVSACVEGGYLALLTIEHDIPTFSASASFNLEVNTADASDMADFRDIMKYMSYGLYMDNSEFLLMGGYDIYTSTINYDITSNFTTGLEQFYLDLPDGVLAGTATMIVRITYTLDGTTYDSSEFALGYFPVEIQQLAGNRRMCLTTFRQLFRGKHDTTKYNHQFQSINDDLETIEGQAAISINPDYTSLLSLDHRINMLRL